MNGAGPGFNEPCVVGTVRFLHGVHSLDQKNLVDILHTGKFGTVYKSWLRGEAAKIVFFVAVPLRGGRGKGLVTQKK